MRPSRIITLIIGCLLVIPGLALLIGGSALGLGYAFGRGDDGYFDHTLDRLEVDSAAITAEDITFAADPGTLDGVLDALDADVRLRATSADTDRQIFIGIAREVDVDRYLAGVAHDEIDDVDDELVPSYLTRPGSPDATPPGEQDFWEVSAVGSGTQEITWEAASGRWAAVLMHADGAAGVEADLNVGAKAGFIVPLALILGGIGLTLTAVAVALIIAGGAGARHRADPDAGVGARVRAAEDVEALSEPPAHPVAVSARLEPGLSQWKWLVKWFLAIPHLIVLAVLGSVSLLMTLVAGVAVLSTGRYPRGLFDFNVGVLRWSWRVSNYAFAGGLGTDRYPPFSLRPEPGEAASLDIAYPGEMSRPLVLVKWLLAIPHLVIVAIFTGWTLGSGDNGAIGLLGALSIVAGGFLLLADRYPSNLFGLIVGLNRWVYRTVAYVAFMTDDYPPFRLDQGADEPAARPAPGSEGEGHERVIDLTTPPTPPRPDGQPGVETTT